MKIGIIGGTGFTGRELVKILNNHKHIQKINVYGRKDGVPLSDFIPEIKGVYDELIQPIALKMIIDDNDLVFLALPHTISMDYVPQLIGHTKLIDLSADYRLKDPFDFQKYYHKEHQDTAHLDDFVYGLPEVNREDIQKSDYVANPGCYPTSILLGIWPLLQKDVIQSTIIVDAKSGYSGAGKKLSEALLVSHVEGNIQPYKVLCHQHCGEINQFIRKYRTKSSPSLLFTPHLLPFDRGILSSIYLQLKKTMKPSEIESMYEDNYVNEPFVRLIGDERFPSTQYVKYSNFCDIKIQMSECEKYVVVLSAIDNLIKGASGQAVQNMNIMLGFNEKEGLL